MKILVLPSIIIWKRIRQSHSPERLDYKLFLRIVLIQLINDLVKLLKIIFKVTFHLLCSFLKWFHWYIKIFWIFFLYYLKIIYFLKIRCLLIIWILLSIIDFPYFPHVNSLVISYIIFSVTFLKIIFNNEVLEFVRNGCTIDIEFLDFFIIFTVKI